MFLLVQIPIYKLKLGNMAQTLLDCPDGRKLFICAFPAFNVVYIVIMQ